MQTDIKQLLPTTVRQGLLGANSPSALNPFATIADITSNAWALNGNTVGSIKWIGTIDNFDFPIRTNSVEVARFSATGDFGINTTAPGAKFHVVVSAGGINSIFQNGLASRTIIQQIVGTPADPAIYFFNDTSTAPTALNYSFAKKSGNSGNLFINGNAIILETGGTDRIIITNGRINFLAPGVGSGAPNNTYNFGNAGKTGSSTGEIINFNVAANTQSWLAGSFALNRSFSIGRSTYSFAGPGISTITDAVTFEVVGSPIAGTNALFTRSWAARLLGNVAIGTSMYIGDITGTTSPAGTLHVVNVGGGGVHCRVGSAAVPIIFDVSARNVGIGKVGDASAALSITYTSLATTLGIRVNIGGATTGLLLEKISGGSNMAGLLSRVNVLPGINGNQFDVVNTAGVVVQRGLMISGGQTGAGGADQSGVALMFGLKTGLAVDTDYTRLDTGRIATRFITNETQSAMTFDVRIASVLTEAMRINEVGSLGLGTTLPDASALFEMLSVTKGFLPPRMTNAQRTAIVAPAIGLIVYCTDIIEGLYINKSTGWTFII